MFEIAEQLLYELGLPEAGNLLGSVVESSVANDCSHTDFLIKLLTRELEARKERNYLARLKKSGLPYKKSISEFDFSFAKSVDKARIQQLAALSFIHSESNIVFLGPPGVGKTHLFVAIALIAIEHGHSLYFTTMAKLVNDLAAGSPRRMSKYLSSKLLVIDEIGYKSIDRKSASVFFDIISYRYERSNIIWQFKQELF